MKIVYISDIPPRTVRRTLRKKTKDAKEAKLKRGERYWIYFLDAHKDDLEIMTLVAELKIAYAQSELSQIFTIEKYMKGFCRSFAIVCDITDSKVHIEEAISRIKRLNVFGHPLDEYMLPLVKALGRNIDPELPAVIFETSEETRKTTRIFYRSTK